MILTRSESTKHDKDEHHWTVPGKSTSGGNWNVRSPTVERLCDGQAIMVNIDKNAQHYYFLLAHWYFIARGVKTKQIGEIPGMVILRTRKLKMSWLGILS